MTLMPLCATGLEALDVSRVASNPPLLGCQNTLAPFSYSWMMKCYALQHNWPNNSDFSTMAAYIWLHFYEASAVTVVRAFVHNVRICSRALKLCLVIVCR